jgi:hypothetical protein
MRETLTAHLADLVATLNDLRHRLRQAARLEVARAVGETLREVALAMICGPHRHSTRPHSTYSPWDDPWQEADQDRWDPESPIPESITSRNRSAAWSVPMQSAVVLGLGAARWGFVRTGQLVHAALIGVALGVAAYVGGPTSGALLGAWSAAHDLMSYPDPERRL